VSCCLCDDTTAVLTEHDGWMQGYSISCTGTPQYCPQIRKKIRRHFLCTTLSGCLQIWQNEIPSFSGFPDPLNSLFHTIIKLKPDVVNHLSSHFGTFLVYQNPAVHISTRVATQTYMSACCVTCVTDCTTKK